LYQNAEANIEGSTKRSDLITIQFAGNKLTIKDLELITESYSC
jgi:hypothetical protein